MHSETKQPLVVRAAFSSVKQALRDKPDSSAHGPPRLFPRPAHTWPTCRTAVSFAPPPPPCQLLVFVTSLPCNTGGDLTADDPARTEEEAPHNQTILPLVHSSPHSNLPSALFAYLQHSGPYLHDVMSRRSWRGWHALCRGRTNEEQLHK